MTTRRLPIVEGLVVALGIMVSVLFLVPETAYAGGAVGGSGVPGGCSGGCSGGVPHTINGYGWYRFSSSGGGPASFKVGNWASVSQTCRDTGNDTVVAFIIQRPSGGPSGATVYTYEEGEYNGYYNYKGDDGAPWLENGTAADLFNKIDASLRSGWTFGVNVAWFCYQSTPPWTIDPPVVEPPDTPDGDNNTNAAGAVADRITAVPGDKITWTHAIRNAGPSPTGKVVTYRYQNRQGLGDTAGPNNTLAAGAASGTVREFTSTYVVSASDLTKNLCRSTTASPRAWNNDGWLESPQACVSVPYNYTLTPTATLATARVIEGSSTARVDMAVDNVGPTQSAATQWQLTKTIVEPGGTVPNAAGGTSGSAALPCGTYFDNADSECSTVLSGSSVFGVGGAIVSGDQLTQQSVDVGDLEIGTKVCFAFSVQPQSSTSTNWRHSAQSCIAIGKKPKVQVWGGDLSVGKGFVGVTGAIPAANIITGTSMKDISGVQRLFGSWVEYGIFATGRIGAGIGAGPSTASGSAYGGDPAGLENATVCNTSTLSFTNASASSGCTESTTLGGYSTTRSIPDVAANFPITASTPSLTASDLSDPAIKGLYTATADLVIAGGTINKGRWIVLNAPSSTVTITGNILYTSDTLQSARDIPQLIIIAKNIIIADTVTRIDSWLVAKGATTLVDGKINTCGTVGGVALVETDPLTADICNQQLTVNGPVMANKLFLRRTFGSGTGTASGDPAEIFNLRPDAYMWAASRSQSNGRIQTVYSTELPPRL